MCILQGPIAVKHCKVPDEPIAELLGNIEADLIKKTLAQYYGGDEEKIPTIDYLGATSSAAAPSLAGVEVDQQDDDTTFSLRTTLPEPAAWLEALAGPKASWRRALLTSRLVVQGTAYVDNPIQRLLAPRKGQTVRVTKQAIHLYGATRSYGPQKSTFEAARIVYDSTTKKIDVTVFEDRTGSSVPLSLEFLYRPDMGFAPIHEVVDGRNTRIKEFYWKLWFGDNESLPEIGLRDTFTGPEVTISAAAVESFCSVVGNQGEVFKGKRSETLQAPMDFAIVTGWQVSCFPVFLSPLLQDLITFVLPGDHEGDFPGCH